MAKDIIPTSNRATVENNALAIVFADKSAPLIPAIYSSKTGAVTYSSIRAGLKEAKTPLTGDALTTEVNRMKNEYDAATLAGVIQLHREGFHFQRFNGRQLKSGVRTVSVAMSNGGDKGATPAKKLCDMTAAELRELADIRDKEASAITVDVEASKS